MAQNAHHQRAGRAARCPAPTAERMSGVDSALERLWHFLTSMKLALVLMLAFAALTLVGTLIIQAPAGRDGRPAGEGRVAGRDPPAGSAAGRTSWTASRSSTIFTSVWLRAIGALLAASLIACTVHRIPGTWRTMRQPHVDVGPAFFEHAPQHEAMTFHREPDEVLGQATGQVFRRHHYRTLTRGRRHRPPLRGPQPLGAAGRAWSAHISIVVILAGAMVGSMFGFRDAQFMLAEGSTSAIPTLAGATITLNSFKDTYNTDDRRAARLRQRRRP